MKCDVSKCNANCCYNPPLPKSHIFALSNRIVNKILELVVLDDTKMCYAITDHNPDKNKCPFLTNKCKCNIYDRRPEICKRFGDGSEPLLTCPDLEDESRRQEILDGYKSNVNRLSSELAWSMVKRNK